MLNSKLSISSIISPTETAYLLIVSFLLNENSMDYCIIKYKQKISPSALSPFWFSSCHLQWCRWHFFFFSKDSLNSCCCCSESILLVPCLSILSPLDKKSVLSLFFTLEHLPAQSRIYFVCFFAKLS